MLEVPPPKPFWKQHLDQLSQELLAPIAKQLLCLVIDQNDLAFGVDNHNPIRSRLQKTTEPCFSSFRFGTSLLLINWKGAISFDGGFPFVNEAILPV